MSNRMKNVRKVLANHLFAQNQKAVEARYRKQQAKVGSAPNRRTNPDIKSCTSPVR